jgi:tetratricopeptide (TPR) repeat protein
MNPDTELPAHFSERRLPYLDDAKRYGSSDAVRRWLLRAEARLARSDQAGAAEALKEAVRLEPGTLQAWRILGQLHESAGRHEEAVGAYERVLEIDPDDVITLNNLAYHLAVRAGKPEAALPHATRANTLSRGNAQIEDTLGWIHHLLGNDRDALPFVVRASRALPRNADVQMHAAVVFAATGRLEDASKALAAAASTDPALKDRPDFQELQKKVARD